MAHKEASLVESRLQRCRHEELAIVLVQRSAADINRLPEVSWTRNYLHKEL